jgi:hypothetical protein
MSHKQDRQDMGWSMPRQQGVVLLVMLALLFIATLLGIALVTSTMGETRMASLRSQREFSHTLAEAGASAVALKALNDLDPNQALQNKTWDCTALGWQGGMGSTTSQTQPGACTIALEAQGGSYSGWLKINAGSSDTMANQLRAQAAVVPLLSGIGPIIGAPGRAGFVVAAATVNPDPGAASDQTGATRDQWLKRNGGWYWPVATSAAAEGQTPTSTQSSSTPTTTTQPFALKAIPTPSNLPDQPWTTYSWTDYKRGLGSDSVAALKSSAGIVDGTSKSDTVSQRYQHLKDAYKKWEDTGNQYDDSKAAALVVAMVLDATGTVQQAAGLAANLAGAATGTATAGTGTVVTTGASTAVNQVSSMASDAAMQTLLDQMNSAGQAHIDAAVAVIEARQAIRNPWGSLDTLHQAENGIDAVWSCGSDGTERGYTTEMSMTDADFQTKTASRMPVISNEALSSAVNSVLGITKNVVKYVPEVTDAANALQSTAQGQPANSNSGSGGNSGSTGAGGDAAPGGNTQLPGGGGSASAPGSDTDPIGTAMADGPGGADTSSEKEPEFMLVDTNTGSLTGISTGDSMVQTNPMCNADAELIIQAQSGTSSGSGTSPSSASAGPCQPGASENSQNSNDRACNNHGSNSNNGNGEGNPPGQTENANNGGNGNSRIPSGATGSSGIVAIQEATIVHTGPITFKAEAPLQNGKVVDILVSKGKITVASDQQDQSGTDGTTTTSGHAGMILWADSDIAINRPVEGAAVAGATVTVATQSQNSGTTQNAQMLTYNPAVDPGLLGNGKFPLAGYTLGSWTSLASTP